jgi:threonine synthase
MWKAFSELAALGWLPHAETPIAPALGEPPVAGPVPGMPRMISVQSDGCAPIATAFAEDRRFAELFANAHTAASGLRVPVAVGDFMILDAVRASGGCALAVPETKLLGWMREACALEGIALCPEAAACVGALQRLVAEGKVKPDERIVIFNTGAVQKYVEAMAVELPRVPRDHRV